MSESTGGPRGPAESSPVLPRPPAELPADRGYRVELAADLEDVKTAMAKFEDFCGEADLPVSVTYRFELALDEVLTNAANHGFVGDGYTTPPSPSIRLTVLMDEDFLTAWIEDNGRAFNPLEEAPIPDLTLDVADRPIGGLGVHLVKTFIEELGYERDGEWNRLTLRKPIDGRE